MCIKKFSTSIISVGDNVVDNYIEKGFYYPGGNCLNVSVFSRRFGASKSSYMGIVENDAEGEHIINVLTEEGVEISRIRQAIGESGKAYVSLNKNGDRVFSESNKGGIQSTLKINFTNDDLNYISKFDVLHSSIYSHIDQDIKTLSSIIKISYDFSTFRNLEKIKKNAHYIDFAFFSCSDLTQEESEELAEKALSLGIKNVILTRGADKAMFISSENRYKQSIYPTTVVDTLGAGDSFIAGFLISYFENNNIEESMDYGARVASKTCQQFGAFGHPKPFN